MLFMDNAIHHMLMNILFQVPVTIDYHENKRFLQKFPVENYALCKQALNDHFCTSIQKSYRKILTYFNALCISKMLCKHNGAQ